MRLDVLYTVKRITNMNSNEEVKLKVNVSEVARNSSCDWRTAKKYIEGYEPKERKRRPSKLDFFKEFIKEKYNQGVTAKSIYMYIKDVGYKGKKYEGKYTILRDFCFELKTEKDKKAVIRYETLPGEQAQVDWKEQFKLYTRCGKLVTFNIFLYALSFSRVKYLEVTHDRDQKTLFNCMINAFRYTGGIPDTILFDNMKTVVDRARSEFTNVVLNEKFRQFSLDLGFKPSICRAYRPQSKGRVESLARLVDRLKVYNNEIDSVEEIYDIIKNFNEQINNEFNQAIKDIPNKLIEKEKEYLNPINDILCQSYISEKPIIRIVNQESMIEYKGCKYSVPTRLIGKSVELKVETNQLIIYYNNSLVINHQISSKLYNYDRNHLNEIIKNDAFSKHDDKDIEAIAEQNLAKLDQLYKIKENLNE